ncbi:MAG TPA: DUF2249 domain-containing protein [Burkholderiaceae bacterium]|nr:DUF2249 domain-containing protein [Burkholderiaceae bacterium]
MTGPADGAPRARVWHAAAATHIDVRGLPRPQPLIEVLQLVRQLPDDALLIVHHDRDPVMLYPELLQIGWCAEPIEGEPGEVRLRVTRQPT